MFEEKKFLKRIEQINSIEDFSELLKEANRLLPKEETSNIFNDLKAKRNVKKHLGVIFNHKCSEKEAYRREFNRPCPYCGNLEHMDSFVLDIIEEGKSYKLKKVCNKCGKTYITDGSTVRK